MTWEDTCCYRKLVTEPGAVATGFQALNRVLAILLKNLSIAGCVFDPVATARGSVTTLAVL